MYPAPVQFGAWHPLERAAEAAPPQPGVLQARADTLLLFPRGKSAMVLYARCESPLDEFVRGPGAALLARASELGARWVRFGASARPAADHDRLLRQFEERFGAPPPANA